MEQGQHKAQFRTIKVGKLGSQSPVQCNQISPDCFIVILVMMAADERGGTGGTGGTGDTGEETGETREMRDRRDRKERYERYQQQYELWTARLTWSWT